MENKGLCLNCANNDSCIFTRKKPVIYCEEHFAQNLSEDGKKDK